MTEQAVQSLSEVSFFDGIPEASRQKIMDVAEHHKKRKGSYLFREGNEADSVWIIREGKVKLSHDDPEGNEQIIGIFSDHEAIWEGIFLQEAHYPYSAVCLKTTKAYQISVRNFKKLLQEDVAISLGIITLLSRKLHDANARNRILATKEPSSRIAGLLVYHSERTKASYVSLKLDDIAASLDLRPETVSRKMREMEKQGLICRMGKGRLEVTDYRGLRELYEGV